MTPRSEKKKVVMLIYPDVQILDVTGPIEVFNVATRLLGVEGRRQGYDTELVAPDAGVVRSSGGIQLVADRTLRTRRGPIDTLLVAGGIGSRKVSTDRAILAWLRRNAAHSRRVASICSGAALLAAAGLLDGRRATTHWAFAEELAAAYPKIEIDPDPVYVRDGNVYTSAGVTSGMDLALALVEEDFGRELALTVARWLVMFLKRPGGQSQFSVQLSAQEAEREPLRDVQAWVLEHLSERISVERDGGACRHECAQLRSRLCSRGRRDAGALRRAGPRRAGSPTARGYPRRSRRDRRRLWFRKRGDDAPGVPAQRPRRSGRLSKQISNQRVARGALPMEIAILLYENFTALDCIGPYEVLSRLPEAEVVFVSADGGTVRSDTRALAIVTEKTLGDVPSPGIVLVPGGPGDEAAAADARVTEWLARVHQTTKWTTSVCTGSIILAAAGLLKGVEATTHWASYDHLRALGAIPVARRFVQSGKIITAAGVSAGIDMALDLLAREAGEDYAKGIQLAIEYDPQPPFDCGTPEKAPAHVVEMLRAYFAEPRPAG